MVIVAEFKFPRTSQLWEAKTLQNAGLIRKKCSNDCHSLILIVAQREDSCIGVLESTGIRNKFVLVAQNKSTQGILTLW